MNRSLSVVDGELVWSSPKTDGVAPNCVLGGRDGLHARDHRRATSRGAARGWSVRPTTRIWCSATRSAGVLHPDRFTRWFRRGSEERRRQADQVARPEAHVGDTGTASGHTSEGGERTARSHDDKHHARHLQPRAARTRHAHGRNRGRRTLTAARPVRRRRFAQLETCCTSGRSLLVARASPDGTSGDTRTGAFGACCSTRTSEQAASGQSRCWSASVARRSTLAYRGPRRRCALW